MGIKNRGQKGGGQPQRGDLAAWSELSNGIEPHTDNHALTFDGSGHLLAGNDGGIYLYDPANNNGTDLNNNLNTIEFFGVDP